MLTKKYWREIKILGLYNDKYVYKIIGSAKSKIIGKRRKKKVIIFKIVPRFLLFYSYLILRQALPL